MYIRSTSHIYVYTYVHICTIRCVSEHRKLYPVCKKKNVEKTNLMNVLYSKLCIK